jgi:RNA polymerase sigma-70 factor, ECF subfamily
MNRTLPVTSDSSDQHLVEAVARQGSEAAFRTLYIRHSPRLLTAARRMTASSADAEDVVQEAWLRALRGMPSFEWRSSLRTWLTGIVANVARELLARRKEWVDLEHADKSAQPESTNGIETIDLDVAMKTLSPGTRMVFVLHDLEGFTHAEIAAKLACTTGTSKKQLFRARRALRALLQEEHS